MAPSNMVKAGDFASITALTRQAVANALGFTLAHIGVNGLDAQDGIQMARRMSHIFGLPIKDGLKSAFSGTMVEFSKGGLPGKNGHIGIGTINVARAMHFLERRGATFREEYRHYDGKVALDAIYLDEEIGGFAIHIVRRA
ncbi:MAG: hypothetical protein Q4D04_05770 [Clostridia bacterium]|nr:hypothetical protein [Clostridia bacterium]